MLNISPILYVSLSQPWRVPQSPAIKQSCPCHSTLYPAHCRSSPIDLPSYPFEVAQPHSTTGPKTIPTTHEMKSAGLYQTRPDFRDFMSRWESETGR